MEYSLLLSIIENSQSGFILLDKDMRILYVNKIIKSYLGDNIDERIGNYFNCYFPTKERVICQSGEMCDECILNKSVKEVIQSKKNKTIQGFKIKKNNLTLNA